MELTPGPAPCDTSTSCLGPGDPCWHYLDDQLWDRDAQRIIKKLVHDIASSVTQTFLIETKVCSQMQELVLWAMVTACPSPPTSRCFTATSVVTLHPEETDEPQGLPWCVASARCNKAEQTAEEKTATAVQTGREITVNAGQGDDRQKARNLNDNGETESFYAIIPRVLIGGKDEFSTDGAGQKHSH
ncbi:unnamed protein product [Rangifer tarandus platyrhynchus]|uniref:Uncharacterized protein n=2 Tax=Rangifer tarandus platyrhynchus TaxID=3082113 RepID=A0ACB0EN32_RANTA|nr:unnamed protein product [Rangifer tarandus platyrhynchus]CAI9702085.1 unnamed protein product [Rangifer tarandus platyrhynchus]